MPRQILPKVSPLIALTFEKPRGGYWDGGMKSGGTFTPIPHSDGTIEWACWELNYWFRLDFGKSWEDAASLAKRTIKRECKVNCTLEVIWS
jgi:hypothetical protein